MILSWRNTRACCIGKATNEDPLQKAEKKTDQRRELIHSDVCGPLPVESISSRYFITFIDDYFRHEMKHQGKDKRIYRQNEAPIRKENDALSNRQRAGVL